MGNFLRKITGTQSRSDRGRQAEQTFSSAFDKQKQFADYARQQRLADMQSGRERGEQLFGNEGLGRVSQERSQEIGDIIARRRRESQGFTPEEMSAFRGQQLGNVDRNLATQQRALRQQQASAGVFGPAALAQQRAAQAQSNQVKGDIERKLFLDNILQRREGLGSLEQSIQKARADELGREQFNLDRLGREKFGILGTELGYAGLGSAERAGAAQQALGQATAVEGAKRGKK